MTIKFQYKIAFVFALVGFQAATAQKKRREYRYGSSKCCKAVYTYYF